MMKVMEEVFRRVTKELGGFWFRASRRVLEIVLVALVKGKQPGESCVISLLSGGRHRNLGTRRRRDRRGTLGVSGIVSIAKWLRGRGIEIVPDEWQACGWRGDVCEEI